MKWEYAIATESQPDSIWFPLLEELVDKLMVYERNGILILEDEDEAKIQEYRRMLRILFYMCAWRNWKTR